MIVDETNEVRRYDDKYLMNDRNWGVYIEYKIFLIKGVYYVEVSVFGGKKLVWGVV